MLTRAANVGVGGRPLSRAPAGAGVGAVTVGATTPAVRSYIDGRTVLPTRSTDQSRFSRQDCTRKVPVPPASSASARDTAAPASTSSASTVLRQEAVRAW